MKVNYKETLHLKTGQELQRIAKDTAFYSGEERFLALEELEKRGIISPELAKSKENLVDTSEQYTPLDYVPTRQIYKTNMMWVATYLGGPIVAGYIIAANFKAFGEPERAKKTWAYTIVATVAIFAGLFALPEKVIDALPNMLIPLLYTLLAYFLMLHFQKHHIGIHLASGGPVFSWGRVIVIGLIGAMITLAVPLCIYLYVYNIS